MGAIGGYLYYSALSDGLNREDPFAKLTGGRPAKGVTGALNILMLGSDSRNPDNKQSTEWRTDTMIVLHVAADHKKVYLVSIPRDLYVHIPRSPTNKSLGDTKGKINSAYAWGGTTLAVKTIEEYTNVRMDHVVLLDFAGFKQVTDAVGGVDLYIEQNLTSIHPPHRKFKKGMNHLNGAEALDYVRQRYQFPEGDFARMRHQQQFMKALLDKGVSSGTITNPPRLNAFLQSVTKSMTVDKKFSLVDMALQFKNVRSEDLTFLVSPNVGSRDVNGESVVMPDPTAAKALYTAVRDDKVTDWLAQGASPAPSTKSSATPKGGR